MGRILLDDSKIAGKSLGKTGNCWFCQTGNSWFCHSNLGLYFFPILAEPVCLGTCEQNMSWDHHSKRKISATANQNNYGSYSAPIYKFILQG
jgi:hypothetical protein